MSFPAQTLPQLFTRQAQKTPEKTAIIEGKTHFTFSELDSWSNRIASYLIKNGMGRGKRVGVYLPRSSEAIASVLGILKAGAAYVPLSSLFPVSRSKFILEDAQVEFVFTTQPGKDSLPLQDITFIDATEFKSGENLSTPHIEISSNDDCWILYTSGSTGKPKGVRGVHQACINRVNWMWREQPFEQGEVCFQNTALTTVDSFWEIFGPLGKGVPLQIIPDEITEDPRKLIPALQGTDICRICLVPSLLSTILWLCPDLSQRLPNLKLWVVSGEPLSFDLCSRFYEAMPEGILMNQYGLTESCADVTFFDTRDLFKRNDTDQFVQEKPPRIPIGTTIDEVEAVILDENKKPVAKGDIGELVFVGASLSAGYLNRPEEEAIRFLRIDISGRKSERVLCTGDLARCLPDGNIECLGRKDNQVKIRGFRVEVSEIEECTRKEDGVREAIVLPHQISSGETVLTLVVVPEEDIVIDIQVIRTLIESGLPSYMWPVNYTLQSKLPYTATGKVDKNALKKHVLLEDRRSINIDLASKKKEIITELAGIWEDILRISISSTDDFFECGGHSLKAAQIFSMIEKKWNVHIPLADIFKYRTVELLSTRIEELLFAEEERENPILSFAPFLSSVQKGLWFIQKSNPEGAGYNLGFSFVLEGVIEADIVEDALNIVVQRQPLLRSYILDKDGDPILHIANEAEIPLRCMDLSYLSKKEREGRIQALGIELCRQAFSLEESPMLRALLVKTSEKRKQVLICVHHIVSDGGSLHVFFKDFVAALKDCLQHKGTDGALENTFLPVKSLNNTPEETYNSGLVEYWINRLSSVPQTIALPKDKDTSTETPWLGSRSKVFIDGRDAESAREFASFRGVSLSTLFLTALSMLIHKTSQQDEFGICVPVQRRFSTSQDSLIGLMVDASIIRFDLGDYPSFTKMIDRTNMELSDALENMPLPLGEVAAQITQNREKLRFPLADIEYTFQDCPERETISNDIKIHYKPIETGVVRFDLSVSVTDCKEYFEIDFDYALDRFNPPFMDSLATGFSNLLRRLIEAPDKKSSDVEFLTDCERSSSLMFSPEQCRSRDVMDLFQRIAESVPSQTAIKRGDKSLTYRDLKTRMLSLARGITEQGLGTGKRVAVLLPRCIDTSVAILASLASGSAYALIDINLPSARIKQILDLVQPSLLLCSDLTEGLVKEVSNGLAVINLDNENLENPLENPISTSFHDEACIQFTSGSTGVPKGISVTRGNMASYQAAISSVVDSEEINWLAVSNVSFDISFTELVVPLTIGGTVYVSDPPSSKDVSKETDATQIIANNKITHLQCTPSLMRVFLESEKSRQNLAKLNHLLIGGEAFTSELARRLFDCGVNVLWNVYGPTETTVWSMIQRVDRNKLDLPVVDLGRPLAGESIYLLDPTLNPVMPGTIGEICIGGSGVTNGYLNEPSQTFTRFVPDPYSKECGQRLYRTGDYGKILPDGRLEFLGRKDFQIKIRGHRIELGDIEAAIETHPEVASTACKIQKTKDEELLIAAHIVKSEGSTITQPDILDFLSDVIPSYMLPSLIVFPDSLPVSQRGKVDRKALPDLDFDSSDLNNSETLDDKESAIAKIWSKALNIPLEHISRSSNFYALGGHSLLAARVAARLTTEYQSDVSIKQIVSNPVLGDLSNKIQLNNKTKSELINMKEIAEPRKISSNQERIWFIDQQYNGSAFYNIQAGLHISGLLNVECLQDSLDKVIETESALSMKFIDIDGEARALFDPDTFVPIEVVDLQRYKEDRRNQTAMELARRVGREPFDLTCPPLLRVNLYRLAKEKWFLSLVVHHIVADRWSLDILFDKIFTCYRNYNEHSTIPPLSSSTNYLDYIDWEQERLTQEKREDDLAFWSDVFPQNLSLINLPTDFPRPKKKSFKGALHSFEISNSLTSKLKRIVPDNRSLFEAILAIYSCFLGRLAQQSDVVVSVAVADRQHPSVEDTVGLFVNSVPVYLDLKEDVSFLGAIDRASLAFDEARDHMSLSLQGVASSLNLPVSSSVSPLFQTMLVMQNNPRSFPANTGLEFEAVELDTGFSKCDIALYVEEEGGCLRFIFEYDTDLFSTERLKSFEQIFVQLVSNVTTHSVYPVSEISFTTPEEKERQKSLQPQPIVRPDTQTLISRFIEICSKNPSACAIQEGTQSISYEMLYKKVSGLKEQLASAGVRPKDIVATHMDRSIDLIASMLAILASGACYLPIDPSLPDGRKLLLLNEANPKALLVNDKSMELSGRDFKYVTLNASSITSSDTPLKSLHYENIPAALIFTSGSTGVPKGVLLPMQGLRNRLEWGNTVFPYLATDACAARTPLSFVDSFAELISPILYGAKLVVFDNSLVRDTERFAKALIEQNITRAVFTPSLLQALLDELEETGQQISSFNTLFVSGEPLTYDLVRKWHQLHPDCGVVNIYGCTECCADSTFFKVPVDIDKTGQIPLGQPIDNTQVFILDQHQQIVPAGMPGEICIFGEGLSLGYINPHVVKDSPFMEATQDLAQYGQIYRTGDIGRYSLNGEIEFLGRGGRFIKIRGVRIDPGEIESFIDQSGLTKKSAVLETKKGSELTAFVVPSNNAGDITDKLFSYLKRNVPSTSIPNRIEICSDFPLNTSGKIDKQELLRQLSSPRKAVDKELTVGSSFSDQVSYSSETLRLLWSDLLNTKEIHDNSNFFEMGGHSFLAAKLTARLRRKTGVDISVEMIFDNPTFKDMSSLLEGNDKSASTGEEILISLLNQKTRT